PDLVDITVAGVAGSARRMLMKTLTRRGVGVDRREAPRVRRRRGKRLAEEALPKPDTALDGRGLIRMRRAREDAAFAQGPSALGRELGHLEIGAAHALDPVEAREGLVREGVIGGQELVVLMRGIEDHMFDEGSRLVLHRLA